MLYTRQAVQNNIRNREGKRVFYLGKGDQLTSDARDYLSRERIPILPAEQAKKERYTLLNGGFMEGKPEHMTHLNAEILVPKTHPRIAFRGAMDSLEAQLLWCQLQCPGLQKELGELLQFARKILSWEVLEEKVPDMTLLGLSQEELRKRSHLPQNYYGVAHFMPEAADGPVILALNLTRCQARQTELAAVRAFTGPDGRAEREDLLQGLNRLSSGLYILMLQEKASRK